MNKVIFVKHLHCKHRSLIFGSNFEKTDPNTFTVTKQGTSGLLPFLFSGFPDTNFHRLIDNSYASVNL